jgi:hypothetical protein
VGVAANAQMMTAQSSLLAVTLCQLGSATDFLSSAFLSLSMMYGASLLHKKHNKTFCTMFMTRTTFKYGYFISGKLYQYIYNFP